ncbi:hypothetical protein KKH39_05210 [Patescibacteria group bacterium]|nr:hypothetical protein [Patescibacteria group bacterium]
MNFVVPNDKLSKHECPLAVIKCVNFRFRQSDQEFVERGLGFEDFDLYAWPGSAKDVLKNNGFKVSFIEKMVSVSKNMHNVKKLLLLWHWDCEAYGGSKNFKSPEEEEEQYKKDLNTVREMLIAELPDDIEIMTAYSKVVPHGLEYILIE